MKKEKIVSSCSKCGGPMVSKEIQHALPNDPYAYFLVSKKNVCKWCGKEKFVDSRYV